MMDGGSNQSSAVSVPYIGSKISLISNVDIRYEGILFSINTFESTVALQNVRSYGTEGRRQPDIPPNNKTYQYIIFKGKDIKDLTVCEPASTRMPEDPAVVSVNVPPAASSSMMGPKNAGHSPAVGLRGGANLPQQDLNGGASGYGGQRSMYGMHPGRMNYYNNNNNSNRAAPPAMPGYPNYSYNGSGGGRGGYRHSPPFDMVGANEIDMGMHRGGRYSNFRGGGRGGMRGSRRIVGELPPQPNMAMKREVSQAFDFESANAKFDKNEIKTEPLKTENGENTNTTAEKPGKTGYNKTLSFFDQISCETLDRQAGQDSRMDRDKQRELDCQTFGAAAANAARGKAHHKRTYRGGNRSRGGVYGDYGSQALSVWNRR